MRFILFLSLDLIFSILFYHLTFEEHLYKMIMKNFQEIDETKLNKKCITVTQYKCIRMPVFSTKNIITRLYCIVTMYS